LLAFLVALWLKCGAKKGNLIVLNKS